MKIKDLLETILLTVLLSNVIVQSLSAYSYMMRVDTVDTSLTSYRQLNQLESFKYSSGIVMVWKGDGKLNYIVFSVKESGILLQAVRGIPKEELDGLLEKAKTMEKKDFIAMLGKFSSDRNTLARLEK